MLIRVMRAEGHVCEEAEDGAVAVGMVEATMGAVALGQGTEYDAILMDFVMVSCLLFLLSLHLPSLSTPPTPISLAIPRHPYLTPPMSPLPFPA
jgi:CheY-like chemotaxis protein